MRNVALDLGGRKITYCEVSHGQVVKRATVGSLSALIPLLGPQTPRARVAFEACREGWAVDARLREWGQTPLMVDTTRSRRLGIGQHGRKNDRIDAEVLVRALEEDRLPLAHVLSPARQELRFHLGVRRTLVEARAQYVTTIREICRAHGMRVGSCAVEGFARKLQEAALGEDVRGLIAPLEQQLEPLEEQIRKVDGKLEQLSSPEVSPEIDLLRTAPGVGTIVAAAFVSVLDEAKRFRRAHEVESYLGLVPSEDTSGKRRLGAITKKGNKYARAMLTQASWCILRGRDGNPLTKWGRAVAARRGKFIAAVAVARRLAGVLFAMWRDGTVYDPEHLAKASSSGLEEQAKEAGARAKEMARAGKRAERARLRLEGAQAAVSEPMNR